MEKTSAVKGNDDFAINFPKATVESKSLTTGILLVIPHWMQSDKSKRVPLNLECFALKFRREFTSNKTPPNGHLAQLFTALQSAHAVIIAARDTQGSTNFPGLQQSRPQSRLSTDKTLTAGCRSHLTLKGGKETSHMNLQLPGQQGHLLRQTGHPRVAVNNALEPDRPAELEPLSWWNKNRARKSRRRFHTPEQEKQR